MMSPREIKAKRILAGLRVKDLAEEASRELKRPISESTMAQVLGRRMLGDKPTIHDLQKFVAKRLKIPVKELKPPFETARFGTK
jgi:hypothetical protein